MFKMPVKTVTNIVVNEINILEVVYNPGLKLFGINSLVNEVKIRRMAFAGSDKVKGIWFALTGSIFLDSSFKTGDSDGTEEVSNSDQDNFDRV